MQLKLITNNEFYRIIKSGNSVENLLPSLSDMNRANALVAVKRAGSGHLGSSFSAMDIVTHLYHKEMNTLTKGLSSPDRDIYFSSKGHDVPGLYALLYSVGLLPVEKLLALRRFEGLDGHPDIGVPGIEANSGSLGMGISKARGMAWAKRYSGHEGRVFVLTGDGEWQEGQNFEALQGAAGQGLGNLVVIIDHNKVQSDREVDQIVSLGGLEKKLGSFGWHVARCDGHDHAALVEIFAAFRDIEDKPKLLIADTIKGRGVSFMEHPQALQDGKGYYLYHSGAPSDEAFTRAYDEILSRVNSSFQKLGLGQVETRAVQADGTIGSDVSLVGETDSKGDAKPTLKSQAEFVADAYGTALVALAKERSDIVVLDADLAADCRVRQFELTFPDRFIECGIAEQDMVSMAGGLARQGLLPVVNSFASFLTSRANEQIYNNATEKTKIIYVNHYAGLIPAGPGKSHQSLRDIALVSSLPNMTLLQPGTPAEAQMVLEYTVHESQENCLIRLVIGPSPRHIELPADYRLIFGQGVSLTHGDDGVLFAYGPVMLHEALSAAETLQERGFSLQVINMPWLNRADDAWLARILVPHRKIFVLEDHCTVGGLADFLMPRIQQQGLLEGRSFNKFGVDGYPACGTPAEALCHHRLDGLSLANRIEG
jgi:transketolase